MKAILITLVAAASLTSCKKAGDVVIGKSISSTPAGQFAKYTIQKGSQYCDGNKVKQIELTELKFVVKFDSTAVYKTSLPENQYDINKLFGFSDNNTDHHQYSARFGWRWSDNALRLFVYIYNAGAVTSKEVTPVAIGAEIHCSIKVSPKHYVFTVNEVTMQMPRLATTEKARGYQLYPYFGGDEVAPHQINIWIKTLE